MMIAKTDEVDYGKMSLCAFWCSFTGNGANCSKTDPAETTLTTAGQAVPSIEFKTLNGQRLNNDLSNLNLIMMEG